MDKLAEMVEAIAAFKPSTDDLKNLRDELDSHLGSINPHLSLKLEMDAMDEIHAAEHNLKYAWFSTDRFRVAWGALPLIAVDIQGLQYHDEMLAKLYSILETTLAKHGRVIEDFPDLLKETARRRAAIDKAIRPPSDPACDHGGEMMRIALETDPSLEPVVFNSSAINVEFQEFVIAHKVEAIAAEHDETARNALQLAERTLQTVDKMTQYAEDLRQAADALEERATQAEQEAARAKQALIEVNQRHTTAARKEAHRFNGLIKWAILQIVENDFRKPKPRRAADFLLERLQIGFENRTLGDTEKKIYHELKTKLEGNRVPQNISELMADNVAPIPWEELNIRL